MSDSSALVDGSEPKRQMTFGELLAESTDFLDFCRKRLEVDVIDEGPDLMEIFVAERRGGGWVPKE